jgi:hypothetical protein
MAEGMMAYLGSVQEINSGISTVVENSRQPESRPKVRNKCHGECKTLRGGLIDLHWQIERSILRSGGVMLDRTTGGSMVFNYHFKNNLIVQHPIRSLQNMKIT